MLPAPGGGLSSAHNCTVTSLPLVTVPTRLSAHRQLAGSHVEEQFAGPVPHCTAVTFVELCTSTPTIKSGSAPELTAWWKLNVAVSPAEALVLSSAIWA